MADKPQFTLVCGHFPITGECFHWNCWYHFDTIAMNYQNNGNGAARY